MKSEIETTIDVLWNRLKLYPKRWVELKFYSEQIEVLNQKLLDIGTPKGISYDKQSFSNGLSKESLYNQILSDKQELEEKVYQVQKEISFLDEVLKSLSSEVFDFVDYKFLTSHTWEQCEEKFFYSKRYIEIHIRNELKSFLTK